MSTNQDTDTEPTILYRTHKKLRGLPTDHVPLPTRPTLEIARMEVTKQYKNRFQPRWDWKKFAYTDGSIMPDTKQGPGQGAAVYLPPGAIQDGAEETTIPIDTGDTTDGTINRAELAAIWEALNRGATHIATDSQCSINQIQKMLYKPHNMTDHRHQNLLKHIAEQIKQSPDTVHLYKVKAHTGIEGNEKADEMAKKVAQGLVSEGIVKDVPESNSRTGKHWASHRIPPTASNPNPTPRPLPTLDGHLRKIMHTQHKLGQANTQTCYYAHWQKTAPLMMPTESNKFMTQSDITYIQKRTAIQYRCGQLYNNKLAMRWGHTITDKCPLCGDMDGGHHIASGCKKLTKMYMARHNQAGRTILKAILSGERATEVAYTDIGSDDKLTRDQLPTIDKRRTIKLPPNSTRPDIILTTRKPATKDQFTNITLVEIKFCRDSDVNTQLDRATTQHQQLQQRMKQQYACTVHTIPILIGVSGAVYTTYTETAMQQLGVRGYPLRTALRKLHTLAIQQLRTIVSTRRRLERKQTRTSGIERKRGRTMEPPARHRPPRTKDPG